MKTMKMKIPVLFFLAFSNASFAEDLLPTEVLLAEIKSHQVLEGGNSVGVGGDVIDTRRLTAWFYGEKPIVTCYQHAENFGVGAAEVETAVKKSIAQWQEYFKTKKIGGDSQGKVNVNFVFKGRCVGEEDLVLHFGTGPIFGNLRDLKTVESLNNPVAYVNKTYMSRDLKWSKGYIRFVGQGYYAGGKSPLPDWSQKEALQIVVNHELGHVLGFMHAENTVMDARVIGDVFLQKGRKLDASIDGSGELVFCPSCDDSFALDESAKSGRAFFEKIGLAGHKKIRLQKTSEEFWLEAGDLRLKIRASAPATVSAKPVLLSNFTDAGAVEQRTFIQYGYVESPQGRQAVILNYNERGDSGERVVLRIVHEGSVVPGASFSRAVEKAVEKVE